MATYSPAYAAQVGQLFSELVPGMPANIATAWATAESGVNNNPYGMTVGGRLASYPTLQAGIQAAANNLLTNPAYAAVRAALRTGDPTAIASAIVASPWQGGSAGSKYYAPFFQAIGIPVDLSTVPSSAGSSNPGTVGPSSRGLGSNTVQQNIAPDSGPSNTSSVQSLGTAAFGALFGWVPEAIVALTILAVVLLLGYMGVKRLLSED